MKNIGVKIISLFLQSHKVAVFENIHVFKLLHAVNKAGYNLIAGAVLVVCNPVAAVSSL